MIVVTFLVGHSVFEMFLGSALVPRSDRLANGVFPESLPKEGNIDNL